ncbi:MAG: hypothetical protein M1824_003097 [Vezdaea acicularis]|nr:MAG: hypothetical protein M1824_003097 [Vezdaea acicularis]
MAYKSRLYSFGSNGAGQLGNGSCVDVSIPTPSQFSSTISEEPVQIAAGGSHTLVLLSDGSVWAVGGSVNDGHGLDDNHLVGTMTFSQLAPDGLSSGLKSQKYKAIAATWEGSFLVAEDDRILSRGVGLKGELGLGDGVRSAQSFHEVPSFPPEGHSIVDIAGCISHVVVVLSNGDVYGWGSGRKGQLGLPSGILQSPRRFEGINFQVKRAVCGREFTFLIGDQNCGEYSILGSDKWGVQSGGPANICDWKSVGASWGSVFVLFSSGKLLSWGRDDHGQLTPPKLPLLRSIAVGSEHVVALTLNPSLIAWGWGEHGNCGNETEEGDVKGRWNSFTIPRTDPSLDPIPTRIGAGCATSWVWMSA